MSMVRIQVQLPRALKRQLDAMRREGYTAAGYIRHVLEEKFSTRPTRHKRARHR